MIVEPAPLGTRARPRRVARLMGIVVPVVLLAGVIAVGIAGPQPSREPASLPVIAVTDPSATAAPGAAESTPSVVGFPTTIAGLQVHGVRWTVQARNRGLARGVVAVAGYLGMDTIPDSCRDARLGVLGPFCERVAVLDEEPWSGPTHTEADARGFHLHPQFPAGVRVPSQAAFVALSASTQTPPVVVLGRFDDERAAPCVPGGRHCGQELVVERVAWVGGDDYPSTPTVDPAIAAGYATGADLREADGAARDALFGAGYRLLTVLVLPSTIARIERRAAEAASRLDQGVPVWFVRRLVTRGDPSRIEWLIVGAATDEVIASGTIQTVGGPAARDGAADGGDGAG